jgi:membrane-associated HD superfamily phosphohydrolase
MSILWIALEKLTGLHDQHIKWHPYLTLLIAIPAVWIYVLAIREKRQELGGQMTFKQIFIFGLLIGIVVALLTPLAQWICFTYITPNYFQNAIQTGLAQGYKLEDLQANFNARSYRLQGIIGGVVMGALTSLILGAIMRTKKAAAVAQTSGA